MGFLFLKNLENLSLSASFTQYTVTITQVQESVSDFKLTRSRSMGIFKGWSWSPNFLNLGVGVKSPTKNEDSASLVKIQTLQNKTPKYVPTTKVT